MGTRNLTCVKINGEYKVAQYGQWDGYPEGQGKTILAFLHQMNTEHFKERIKACRWATDEEVDEIYKPYRECDEYGAFSKDYPNLTRDTGGEILAFIDGSEGEVLLCNQLAFAADSLFCEWCYVIDFDENTFEVFKGFNQDALDEQQRFAYLSTNKEYEPVRFVISYELNCLPTITEFLAHWEDEDAE